MINLYLRPAVAPVSWEFFCKESPKYSIALDGYVNEGPHFDPEGPRANFNHHEGCDRLATRATCAQVHMAIRQGLFDTFRDESKATACASVYANDCDQDVCLAWYLLMNHYRTEHTMNASLNRLVSMEDMLDTTAGAYPYPPDLPILRRLAWVFEPYTRARLTGALDARDVSVFEGVVCDVCSRIDRHVIDNGGSIDLDMRYEYIYREHQWTVVREIGAQARTALFAEGVRAYVSVRDREDGRYNYTIGRMSPYTRFDVGRLLDRCNELEGLKESADRWGGSTMVGGSPRIKGSSIEPKSMVEIVREVALRKKSS